MLETLNYLWWPAVERFKTEEEKSEFRRILEAISKLGIKELLAYWMNQEMEEAEMYYKLSAMSKDVNWDERISKLFMEMYRESMEHAETLLKLYREIYPDEEVPKVDLPSLEVELSEEQLKDLVYHGKLREILKHLMDTEKIARDVYLYLAEHTSDEKAKETFLWLADIENGHYEKLKRLYVELFGEPPEENGKG